MSYREKNNQPILYYYYYANGTVVVKLIMRNSIIAIISKLNVSNSCLNTQKLSCGNIFCRILAALFVRSQFEGKFTPALVLSWFEGGIFRYLGDASVDLVG